MRLEIQLEREITQNEKVTTHFKYILVKCH